MSDTRCDMRSPLASSEPEARLAVDYLCIPRGEGDQFAGRSVERRRWTRVHRRYRRELRRNPPANLRVLRMAWNRT